MSMAMGSMGLSNMANGSSQPILRLPKIYLTFENFVEASVYLSPRASLQQRVDVAFSVLDANGDGMVDAQEIKNVMLDSIQHLDSNSLCAKSAKVKKTQRKNSVQVLME